MAKGQIPVLSEDSGLSRYLREIRRYPVLTPDEEYSLAKRWRDTGDTEAAHELVTSHLRLVAKIAAGYRGYGLPASDVISEGNIGLMQAVKRFDPEKGYRLATYAVWWIRATIQEFILRSWSLVKIGTTSSQKKLFFNLRRLKGELNAFDQGELKPSDVAEISDRLDVSESDVISMNRRLSGDMSLNTPLNSSSEDGGGGEWLDWVADESQDPEASYASREEHDWRMRNITQALSSLKPREREIFHARRLVDDPETLESLSHKYGISRERVRQIEVRAFEKVQDVIRSDMVIEALDSSPESRSSNRA